MKVYLYSRVSTSEQDLTQQRYKVQTYLDSKGLTLTDEIADKDVSGYKVSYKNRGLANLIDMMQEGDCLICSELSRLARTMADITRLINDDLKPRKLRLIIVSMGIDLDCSRMKAIDELILQNIAFSAQVEAEMIQSRTQAALDAIKHEIATTGKHVSKSGRVISKLGRQDADAGTAWDKALTNSIATNKQKAKDNENNIRFAKWLSVWESKHGAVDRHTDIEPLVYEVNALGYTTSTGMRFNKNSLRQMIYRTHERNVQI